MNLKKWGLASMFGVPCWKKSNPIYVCRTSKKN
uniref:Uncharacterized protein n=1 Tax=Arundo donax TaxID=35708 RepID=A0A0A8YKZ7_ARUDO